MNFSFSKRFSILSGTGEPLRSERKNRRRGNWGEEEEVSGFLLVTSLIHTIATRFS